VAQKTSFAGFAPRRIVAILAFDGVVLGDLSVPCEVFSRVRDAKGSLLYDVQVCSAKPVVRAGPVALQVARRLASLSRAHTVIVPGVDPVEQQLPQPLLRAIRRAAARGARIASICTGAFVLAASGLLDGRRATTHWRAAAELARRHPALHVDPNVLYVDNGNILTSAGAAAGLDLCIHLVRRDLGAQAAAHVARDVVMPPERAGGQAQFIEHDTPATDGVFASLLEWIEQHLHERLTLRTLARRAAMSTRTLSRQFRQHVGATPASWVAHARVRRAQRLFETTDLSVERIAAEAGFRSATVLRARFREVVGTAPIAYRRSFKVPLSAG
jgi:transcriptional regulator GlxA family with amidase domain